MLTKNKITLFAVSGVDKIGSNVLVFSFYQCNEVLFIIDYGISIDNPNYLIPYNTSYPNISKLINNYKKVYIVITHGHEDHIGGFNMFKLLKSTNKELYARTIKKVKVIVATEFNKNIIIAKYLAQDKIELDFHILGYNTPYEYKDSNNTAKIILYRSDHSIPQSSFVQLWMNNVNIVHTGDWTIYFTEKKNKSIISHTKETVKELKKDKIDILICESTRIDTYKHRINNEEEVVDNIGSLINKHYKTGTKIMVTSFSTNITRLIGIAEFCMSKNIPVYYIGQSFKVMLETAYISGLIPDTVESYIRRTQVEKIHNLDGVFICSGAQIEQSSCIYRMLYEEKLSKQLDENYVFIFSTGIIPSNTNFIDDALSIISKKNCTFYHGNLDPIHVSGHASYSQMEFLYKELQAGCHLAIHGDCIKTKLNSRLINLTCPHTNSKLLKPQSVYEISIYKNIDIKQVDMLHLPTIVKIDNFGNMLDKTHPTVEERRKLIREGAIIIYIRNNKPYIRPIGVNVNSKTIADIRSIMLKNEKHTAKTLISKLLKNFKGHIEFLV